ncbi:MAG: antibiotic biosynthesis monooxygenase [Polyangiaceae bacterium]
MNELNVRSGDHVVTLITIFTCKPESQPELVDLLVDGTDTIMRKLKGFVGSSVHRGVDPKKVVNYAQWKTEADLVAMREVPEAKAYFTKVGALGEIQSIVCYVEHVLT